MEPGLTAETKAFLINIGSADIDSSLLPAEMKTTATAGPAPGAPHFSYGQAPAGSGSP